MIFWQRLRLVVQCLLHLHMSSLTFHSGTAISWDGDFNVQTENAIFSSVIDLVLNCGAFIYIGAWLPFASYNSPEVREWLIAVDLMINFELSSVLHPGGWSSYFFVSSPFAAFPLCLCYTDGFQTLLGGVRLFSLATLVRSLFCVVIGVVLKPELHC